MTFLTIPSHVPSCLLGNVCVSPAPRRTVSVSIVPCMPFILLQTSFPSDLGQCCFRPWHLIFSRINSFNSFLLTIDNVLFHHLTIQTAPRRSKNGMDCHQTSLKWVTKSRIQVLLHYSKASRATFNSLKNHCPCAKAQTMATSFTDRTSLHSLWIHMLTFR